MFVNSKPEPLLNLIGTPHETGPDDAVGRGLELHGGRAGGAQGREGSCIIHASAHEYCLDDSNPPNSPKTKLFNNHKGGAPTAHKVFGRRKQAHRREAVEHFVVQPSSVMPGEGAGAGGLLDEEGVLKRVVDYFAETRQVCVVGRDLEWTEPHHPLDEKTGGTE